MNSVILVGRMVSDAELRYIPGSGVAVASFAIAVDRDYIGKDGKRETDFIPVEVMGKSAEFSANYLGKGRLVSIEGSLRIDKYVNKNGENRTFTKVSVRVINALDSRKVEKKQDTKFEPSFEPSEVFGDEGFQALNDEDLPF